MDIETPVVINYIYLVLHHVILLVFITDDAKLTIGG